MNILSYLKNFIPLVASILTLFFSLPEAGAVRLETEIEEQKQRIAALEESYQNGEIAPVDRNSFFDGDLQAELDSGLKFNELRYTATHNSYQTESVDELKQLYRKLDELTFGLIPGNTADFVSPTLTEQLNSGVYSFELDVEVIDDGSSVSFTCMHAPQIQMTTSCYDFALAMKEIAMWSDNNPGHLPITVIVEPKDIFLPTENMKSLSVEYAEMFDQMLRDTLGEKLFTPSDMLGKYGSFRELRADNGWCEVKDMLGRVLILMHDCSATNGYVRLDTTLRTQAMFPMLEAKDMNKSYASFLIINKPDADFDDITAALENGCIVRTRADTFTDIDEVRREKAFACGAQIISTDYPVRPGLTADDYVVCFGEMKTVSR